jgi:hypothetical protein
VLEADVLPKVRDADAAGRIPQVEMMKQAFRWGAYVGEVLRPQVGGTWQLDSGTAGGALPVLRVQGRSVPTMHWVQEVLAGSRHDAISREVEALLKR